MGLDLDGTLEVSNSFPLPNHTHDDDGKSAKTIGMCCEPRDYENEIHKVYSARHQASMLRSLKEVQGDDSVVGFYQATTLGSFFNQTLVDTQAIHQEKLRHGGIVIVHGKRKQPGKIKFANENCRTICRHITDRTGKCLIPCLPIDNDIYGRVQEN